MQKSTPFFQRKISVDENSQNLSNKKWTKPLFGALIKKIREIKESHLSSPNSNYLRMLPILEK